MKSVSFLKSWRRKDSKSLASSKSDTSKPPALEDSRDPGPSSPPTTPPRAPTSPAKIQAPKPTLEGSSALFRENFTPSVEEALHHRRTPERRPDYQHYHHASNRYSDTSRTALAPMFAGFAGPSVGKTHHGPPRNAKHGPTNVLQHQLSSINSSPRSDLGRLSPNHSSASSSLHHGAEAASGKIRTPARVKFDPSVEVVDASSRHSKHSYLRPSGTIGDHSAESVRPDLTRQAANNTRDTTANGRRPTHLSNTMEEASVFPTPSKGLGLHHSTSSSPHLPSPERVRRLSVNHSKHDPSSSPKDISSLFPSPPPLMIRKKVPQPLVLRPRSHSSSAVLLPPPPSPSSNDSTPVSTPTSPRYQSTAVPTQSPLLKGSFGRNGNFIPPLLHDPPTSPLPSPPVPPAPIPSSSRKPALSFHGRSHLRSAMSTSNLRIDPTPNPPTHRMTSSDPIAEVGTPTNERASPPLKLDHNAVNLSRRPVPSEDSDTAHPEPPIQWGYAL